MPDPSNLLEHNFLKQTWGTRHFQVFLVFLGISLTFAGRFGISVAVVAMTDINSNNTDSPVYNWDSEEKAIILSSFAWIYVPAQVPSSILANMYSAHKFLCFGVFTSSLVNALTPLCIFYFGWTGTLICRLLMGLTQSFMISCSHTIISRWIPSEERSRLAPLAVVSPQFGNIINLIVSGWLASSSLGWPSIFYVFGIIGMLWAILFYCVSADSPSTHKTISSEERNYIEKSLNKSTDPEAKSIKIPWKSMLTSVPMWTLVITNCGHSWGMQLFSSKLPAYMKYVLGFDIEQSSLISALPYVATLLMTFVFGWLCDIALKNKTQLNIVRKVSNTVGMWGAGVSLLALCFILRNSLIVTLTILAIIFGLDAANYFGFLINHIDIAPKFAGTQIAISNALATATGQAAILTCGYIVTDETNVQQWHLVFYITVALYFLANLIFVTFGQTKLQTWN